MSFCFFFMACFVLLQQIADTTETGFKALDEASGITMDRQKGKVQNDVEEDIDGLGLNENKVMILLLVATGLAFSIIIVVLTITVTNREGREKDTENRSYESPSMCLDICSVCCACSECVRELTNDN